MGLSGSQETRKMSEKVGKYQDKRRTGPGVTELEAEGRGRKEEVGSINKEGSGWGEREREEQLEKDGGEWRHGKRGRQSREDVLTERTF